MLYSFLHKFKFLHYLSKKKLTEKSLTFQVFFFFFKKVRWSKKVSKKGAKYKIQLKNGVGIMNFISDYETWLDDLLPKLLNSSEGIFIDIGANTGQTLLKVVPFFPEVKYYAIEPNYNCVEYLHSLCKINSFQSVTILNYALSNKEGETELLVRYKDDLLGTTTPSFRKFTRYAVKIKVPLKIGDNLFAQIKLNGNCILKIDVEGGESNVLEGFVNTIKLYNPYIICEILSLISKSEEVRKFRESKAKKIISIMLDLDYKIINIIDKKNIKNIYDLSTTLESCNYLFFPQIKENLIANQVT